MNSRKKRTKSLKFIGNKVSLPSFVTATIVDYAFSKINKTMELKLSLMEENIQAVGLL